MAVPPFAELFERLQAEDESDRIEAKYGREAGKSVLETVSAFSNTPDLGGGYILFGVVRADTGLFPGGYEVPGVPDPDKVQTTLASLCRGNLNVPVRPELAVETFGGKPVVTAFIPEAAPHEKPVFILKRGMDGGAYLRVGSADSVCTDEDLADLIASRSGRTHDLTVLADTSANDTDPRALTAYRRLRAESGVPGGADLLRYDDADLLDALGATVRHRGATCLTVAGLLLFGHGLALRRHLPLCRVDYIRVEGREWVRDPSARYETVEKREALLLMIPSVVAQVLDDLPRAFQLSEDGVHRRDVPQVPRDVIREAVVNAVMHRDYRHHRAVQVVRYSNRVEIDNPGYSLIPDDRLGEPGASKSRNPVVASVLHDVGQAETKGTGVRAMREAMRGANLTVPLFESDRTGNRFTVRLLVHHLLTEADWAWLSRFRDDRLADDEARVLILAREFGAVDNALVRSLTGLDMSAASKKLGRLRDLCLLDQRGSGNRTFYTPSDRLLAATASVEAGSGITGDTDRTTGGNGMTSGDNGGASGDNGGASGNSTATSGHMGSPAALDLASAPTDVQAAVERVGRRNLPDVLKAAVASLCRWRWCTLGELAGTLSKGPDHVRKTCVSPLLRSGGLVLRYPDRPRHPDQAYRAADVPEDQR